MNSETDTLKEVAFDMMPKDVPLVFDTKKPSVTGVSEKLTYPESTLMVKANLPMSASYHPSFYPHDYPDKVLSLILASASEPARREVESETDMFKESVSDLYLYVQSILRAGPGLAAPLPPDVAVFGPSSRITYLKSEILGGGPPYICATYQGTNYDILTMIKYAMFLERCDYTMRGFRPARWNSREGQVYLPSEERAREIENETLAAREQNPTDTYKEICSRPFILGDVVPENHVWKMADPVPYRPGNPGPPYGLMIEGDAVFLDGCWGS